MQAVVGAGRRALLMEGSSVGEKKVLCAAGFARGGG